MQKVLYAGPELSGSGLFMAIGGYTGEWLWYDGSIDDMMLFERALSPDDVASIYRCGNGVLNPGEQCDDGNSSSGDGCSALCETEGHPSCHAIKMQNPSATDGLYTIDPDGAGPIAPAQLFCDMTNGGWTLVANIYDSAGDDAPNSTDYVVSGWQQTASGQWSRSASKVERNASGTGSSAVSLAFVAALKAGANQQHLKMCFVHQNGTDTTCRSSHDGSMTLVSYPTGNPKLTVYSGNTLPYTYGRLAGLAGSTDGYDYLQFSDSIYDYSINVGPGASYEWGDECGGHGGVLFESRYRAWYGVWRGQCRGVGYRPWHTDNNEIGSGNISNDYQVMANPSPNTYGFRIYIGMPLCGNGILDAGEQCDPGPMSQIGCSSSCQLNFVSTRIDGQVQFVESFEGNQMSHMSLCQGCAGIGCPSFSNGRLVGFGDWNSVCVPSGMTGQTGFQLTFDWYPDSRSIGHCVGVQSTALGRYVGLCIDPNRSVRCRYSDGSVVPELFTDLSRPLSLTGGHSRVQVGYVPGIGSYLADDKGVLCHRSMAMSSPRFLLVNPAFTNGEQQLDNVTYSTW